MSMSSTEFYNVIEENVAEHPTTSIFVKKVPKVGPFVGIVADKKAILTCMDMFQTLGQVNFGLIDYNEYAEELCKSINNIIDNCVGDRG